MLHHAGSVLNVLLLRRPSNGHVPTEKKPTEQPPNDDPEELNGYRLERSAAGDQELPTVTYSIIEISQSAQNQEEI